MNFFEGTLESRPGQLAVAFGDGQRLAVDDAEIAARGAARSVRRPARHRRRAARAPRGRGARRAASPPTVACEGGAPPRLLGSESRRTFRGRGRPCLCATRSARSPRTSTLHSLDGPRPALSALQAHGLRRALQSRRHGRKHVAESPWRQGRCASSTPTPALRIGAASSCLTATPAEGDDRTESVI